MNPCPCGYRRRRRPRLPLHAAAGRPLRVAAVGAAARSHRSHGRGRRPARARVAGRGRWGKLRRDPASASSPPAGGSCGGMACSMRAWTGAGCGGAFESPVRRARSIDQALTKLSLSARGLRPLPARRANDCRFVGQRRRRGGASRRSVAVPLRNLITRNPGREKIRRLQTVKRLTAPARPSRRLPDSSSVAGSPVRSTT